LTREYDFVFEAARLCIQRNRLTIERVEVDPAVRKGDAPIHDAAARYAF
jgi:hypothetical protein